MSFLASHCLLAFSCCLLQIYPHTHTHTTAMSDAAVVQRRGRAGGPQQAAAAGPRSSGSAPAAAGGLKTWHLWLLFGLGWPSVLLFFLSTIPAFNARVQGLLLTFGWLFCGCWLANSAAGILTEPKTKKQATVFTASYITAGIGSVTGLVLTASYVLHNVGWLYLFGLPAIMGAALLLRNHLDDNSADMQQAAGNPGATGGAAAVAGSAGGRPGATAEVRDLIDLGGADS